MSHQIKSTENIKRIRLVSDNTVIFDTWEEVAEYKHLNPTATDWEVINVTRITEATTT